MNSKSIYVILCHPYTADNIGAVARAMKNMGFSKLRLVSPRRNWKRRAKILARNAVNILEETEVYSSLDEAVADLNWTLGTTRRIRSKHSKFIGFEESVAKTLKKSVQFKIGIVFGRESKGLTGEEIDRCDQLVSIPADAAYPSLNLAQAVMVTLFSFAREATVSKSKKHLLRSEAFLNKANVQIALNHFGEALKWIGFYEGKEGRLGKILRITESLFKRAGMFQYEAQMLKGVSARIIQRASSHSPRSC